MMTPLTGQWLLYKFGIRKKNIKVAYFEILQTIVTLLPRLCEDFRRSCRKYW